MTRCACGARADYRCETRAANDPNGYRGALLCRACTAAAVAAGVDYRHVEALPHERKAQRDRVRAEEAAQLGEVAQLTIGDIRL